MPKDTEVRAPSCMQAVKFKIKEFQNSGMNE
jgi:hypothetical protein